MPTQATLWSFVFAGVIGVVTIASLLIADYLREDEKKKQLSQSQRGTRKEKEYIPEFNRSRRKKPKSVISSIDSESFCTVLESDRDSFYSFDNETEFELPEEDSETEVNLTQDLKDIERLLEKNTIDLHEAFDRLKNLSLNHSKNVNVYWRLGQICQKLAEATDNLDEKRRLINEGLEFCKQGLEIKKDIHVHKWFAILYGNRALLQTSINDKISDSHLFKTHLDIALEYSPNDWLLWHLLGAYQYEIAKLSWLERKAASYMFPEFPCFTYDDALKSLKRVEEIAPDGEKENRLYIAKCYFGKYDKENGLYWLRKSDEAELCRHKNTDKEIKSLLNNY